MCKCVLHTQTFANLTPTNAFNMAHWHLIVNEIMCFAMFTASASQLQNDIKWREKRMMNAIMELNQKFFLILKRRSSYNLCDTTFVFLKRKWKPSNFVENPFVLIDVMRLIHRKYRKTMSSVKVW